MTPANRRSATSWHCLVPREPKASLVSPAQPTPVSQPEAAHKTQLTPLPILLYVGPGMDSPLPPPLSLLRPGGAPPPPPKNPARLMALALAERAQQVAQRQSQQGQGATPSAPHSPFHRSLSLEVGGDPPGTPGSGPPPHPLAHPSAWVSGPPPSLLRQQNDGSLVRSQRPMGTSRRGLRGPAQVSAQLRTGVGCRDASETGAQLLRSVPPQTHTPGFSSAQRV